MNTLKRLAAGFVNVVLVADPIKLVLIVAALGASLFLLWRASY